MYEIECARFFVIFGASGAAGCDVWICRWLIIRLVQ